MARTWILPGLAIACAFGVGVGAAACSVDPFLMCGDACDDGGAADASLGADSSSTADGSTCDPKTCASYPSDCHPSLDDGCGSTIDCSSACPGGQDCISDAGAEKPGFFCSGPPVCVDAGAPGGNCNTLTNPGTGQTTSCGDCRGGFTCTANTCGCTGIACGTAACCTGGQVCDTTDTTCCTQESTATACGTKCNTTAVDNCHKTVACGACINGNSCQLNTCVCTSGKTCGVMCCGHASDVCFPATTCCTPDSNAKTCNNVCGVGVPNNCGQATNCGLSCANGEMCAGSENCSCGSATCNPGQTCQRNPDQCI